MAERSNQTKALVRNHRFSKDPEIRKVEELLLKKLEEERVAKMAKRVDIGLLESFGITPEDHSLEELKEMTNACVAAVKDGRLSPTTPLNFRISTPYKAVMRGLKTIMAGFSYAKLLTMVLEAVACGDITVSRIRHEPMLRRLYGPDRYLLLDREGRIINTTVRPDRPHGTRF